MRPLLRDTFAEIHTITPEQERAILDRSRWIHEGGRGLRFPEHRLGKLSYHNARQTGWRRGAFRLYVLLMLRNGLRPSEALRLRWDEINLYANPPFMRLKHLEHGDGGRVLKTEKSADAITLARAHKPDQWSGPADSIDVAKELRAFRKEALGPWVFGADDPWTQKPVFPDDHFIWRALKFELGDSRLKAYSLRHTLATRMSARGFTAEEVARVLRNTARVCERYYIAGTRERDAFDISTAQRVQVRQALA